jgi:hypothetical protein
MQAELQCKSVVFQGPETYPVNDNDAPWRCLSTPTPPSVISFEVYAAILFGVIPPEAAPYGFDAGPVPRLVRG